MSHPGLLRLGQHTSLINHLHHYHPTGLCSNPRGRDFCLIIQKKGTLSKHLICLLRKVIFESRVVLNYVEEFVFHLQPIKAEASPHHFFKKRRTYPFTAFSFYLPH